ncbi:MAG: hypothetical protein JRI87_12755 [Deltaproteobacteria bacterium]|nr:hypothetical protein [Deltaproteobacteria bacterium]
MHFCRKVFHPKRPISQVKLARQQGIEVVEVKPSLPQVTPDRLDVGKDAWEASYNYTITALKDYGD